jgi:tetratricopeptide (TPR) repeat protein
VTSKRKKERQELKNPDQFVSFWARVGAIAAARSRAIVTVLVTVVVVTGGVQIGRAVSTKKAAEQTRAFGRIQAIANAPLLPDTGVDPMPGGDIPKFKTHPERLAAAIREADSFLAAHGKGRLGPLALVLKGRLLLESGKASEATAVYESLAQENLDPEMALIAQEGKAYALEAAGKKDAAAQAFATLAAEAQKLGDFQRDQALFNQARLAEQSGDAKKAQSLYREVVEKFPSTPLRDEVNARIALLEEATEGATEETTGQGHEKPAAPSPPAAPTPGKPPEATK